MAVLVQVPPLPISAGHVVRVMSDDTPPSLHLTSPSYCAHLSERTNVELIRRGNWGGSGVLERTGVAGIGGRQV